MIEKIYRKLEDDSDYTILDSRSIMWSNFKFTNGYKKHYVSSDEILKPYLISMGYYGTVEYEDVILLVNNIQDPYELIPGIEINIPNLQDIQQFIVDNTK
jgi:hypothetical protein